MKTKENNFAFIDSQNLNLGVQSLGWKLNYKRFRIYLKEKYKAGKVFLFIGYIAGNESLYTSLQSKGYILIFKPILYLPNGKVKGNVDAELVLHAMIEYPNYDKAIIVSGDGDFHCLIDYLRKQNKLLKLIVPDWNNYSSLLRKFVPNIAFMNTLKEKLKYKKSP